MSVLRMTQRMTLDWIYLGVGELIRQTREDRGLSIAQAARKVGLSDRAILNAEIGQSCSIATLYLIAEALGTEPEELLPRRVKR